LWTRSGPCDLPFEDGSFDVVLSSLALHNIHDREERDGCFREHMRVLKPDRRASGFVSGLSAATADARGGGLLGAYASTLFLTRTKPIASVNKLNVSSITDEVEKISPHQRFAAMGLCSAVGQPGFREPYSDVRCCIYVLRYPVAKVLGA